MNQEQMWRELTALPPDAQQQVADLIAFLRARYAPSSHTSANPPNLVDEPFIGMWRDHPDVQDSPAWVRQMREQEWG